MELITRLKQLAAKDKYPFHMPGHKGRFPDLFVDFDPTELPGLDNLHSPQDTLKRAQQRVARIYGAAETFFLVNGSSVGLMAAIATFARRGERILVARNCHKAVFAGLIHSGAMPVWADQQLCTRYYHWLPPTATEIEKLLANNSIQAAIFTNPDYFGFVPDLAALIEVCARKSVRVIIDEAHGAHLNWGAGLGLPPSGVKAGADIVVQSAHKTLPALTQTAWLHLADPALAEEVQHTLNLFQTTSPSYLLLSSLEYAGAWADAFGSVMLKRLRLLTRALTQRCKQLGLASFLAGPQEDWTKFVLANRPGLLQLLHKRGIYPELVQEDKMLFMLTLADAAKPQGMFSLYRTLPLIAALPEKAGAEILAPPLPQQVITPREAWQRRGERVPLSQAAGRIARQVLAPYPPGTMVIGPGQRIESEQVDMLLKLQAKKVISQWIEVI